MQVHAFDLQVLVRRASLYGLASLCLTEGPPTRPRPPPARPAGPRSAGTDRMPPRRWRSLGRAGTSAHIRAASTGSWAPPPPLLLRQGLPLQGPLQSACAAFREAMAAARRPASAMMAALGTASSSAFSTSAFASRVDRERLRAPTANPRLLHVGGGVVGEVRPAIPHLGRHVFGETQAAVRVEQSICSSAWT